MQCFDTIVLPTAGEYFIRGHVGLKEGFEGSFEPETETLDRNKDGNWIAASSIVKVDERGNIPVRIWTFENGVRLKKGMNVGKLLASSKVNNASSKCVKLRHIVKASDEGRWETLKPQFEKQLSQLMDAEKNMLLPLLQEFADIFSIDKNDIGLTDVVQHEIDTGLEKPIACPYRRVPMPLEDKVEGMVQDLVNKGIIRPSDSPWNAPLVVVPKKNGDIRLTVDYRKLNAVTKRPIFPIPDTRHLLDTLHGSAYFSTLDLSSGYYNVPMCESDIDCF